LAVSPDFARDGVLFAGALEDGVFRSADRGDHWHAWNFGLLDLSVLCMALSPAYAQDETLFVGTTTGIFRSTNGGRAWREVGFPTESAPVLSLALSPGFAADGVLFAGTETAGLHCSQDGGDTWAQVGENAIADCVNAVILAPEFPGRPDVLAVLSDTLLISRDRGRSWSAWQLGLTVEQGIVCAVAPDGLAPGAQLLLGLVDGGILVLPAPSSQITLSSTPAS
jgi:hypothetical protein